MSSPIKLTEELIREIKREFAAKLKDMTLRNGKLEYSKELEWGKDKRATVVFSPAAFAKMAALIQQFSTEIAWHGVVYRDDEAPDVFHITDILVYPQIVSGATVNTDQDAYQTWLYSFDDEVFSHIRMQGHSHVNMAVSPSGTDIEHQEKLLAQVGDDDYYIFMIWNKSYECFVRIYDRLNNTLYGTKDVDVLIGDEGVNLNDFMNSVKKVVTTREYYSVSLGAEPPKHTVKGRTKAGQGYYCQEDYSFVSE